MSQLENKITPIDLRTQLHKMVVADLLGPAGGVIHDHDPSIRDARQEPRQVFAAASQSRATVHKWLPIVSVTIIIGAHPFIRGEFVYVV